MQNNGRGLPSVHPLCGLLTQRLRRRNISNVPLKTSSTDLFVYYIVPMVLGISTRLTQGLEPKIIESQLYVF